MKDMVPKGTGNSRFLKSVSNFLSLYPTYNDFVAALIAGTLPVDFNGINSAGCAQVGTALNKANLLDDTTAAALELTGDPTVNQALYALSQKGSPAEVHVLASSGATVTMTKGSTVLTATAGSDGWAILYPTEFGTYTLRFGSTTKSVVIDAIKVYYFVATDLQNLTWAQVSSISKMGIASSIWNVGDTKTLTVNGVTYTAVIIGFDHDDVTSPSSYGRDKAGITWQLLDCLNTTYKMENSNTNVNGWGGCVMRNTNLRSTIWGQLTTDLKNAIVSVNKLTSAGNQSSTIQTSSDTLFLLSEVEIFGNITNSKAGEGTQYDWYKAGNPKIKKVNGSARYWWERSPFGADTTGFCCVSGSGYASGDSASSSLGVSFGFCV